jgi:single-strand DNA-binding protein
MNNTNLIGRLTADPELKYTQSGTAVSKFTIAVDRQYKNASGERETDFIRCVAFKKTAEIIAQYQKKGNQIGVSGRIQTGSYDKDGVRHYTTDILVDNFTFLDNKKDGKQQQRQQSQQSSGQMEPMDISDDSLPF